METVSYVDLSGLLTRVEALRVPPLPVDSGSNCIMRGGGGNGGWSLPWMHPGP